MTRPRRHTLPLAFASVALLFILIGSLVIGRRSDLSEKEIKRLWKQSARKMKTAKVAGAFPYIESFRSASAKNDVPVPLLLAMARGESNFNARAKSTAECYGIMQIQWPGTAKDLGFKRKSELFDPHKNIEAGAKYIAKLIKMFNGDHYLAVAAYNYGPGRIKRSAGSIPEGAQWYAAYVHRHLETVMAGPYVKTDRTLLLEFTYYKRAVRYMEYLQGQIEGVPLEIFRSNKYTFDVYLMHKDQRERRRFLAKLSKLGVKPLED